MGKFLHCVILIALSSLFLTNSSFGQFTITQNFKGNSAGSNVVLGGVPNSAFLTSGLQDPVNNGWLRLTKDTGNQRGYAYVNSSFPSSLGVLIDFEYKSWRDNADLTYNGADGICVFLFDASATFKLGGWGGSLGYAPNANSSPAATTGLAGGYIGLGLDEYGNYAAASEGKNGGTVGIKPNSIVLRGPTTSNPSTTNAYLTSVQLQPSSSSNVNSVDYNTVTSTRPTDAQYYRRVKISIVPVGTPSNPLYNIGVTWRTSPNGIDSTILNYTTTTPPPANLKVGFAASTGGGFNYHDIRNVLITTPGGVRTDKSVNNPNVLVGSQVTYTVNAYNSTTAPITNLILSDTIKDGNGNTLSIGPTGTFNITGITFNNNGAANTAVGYTSGVTKTSGFTNPFSTSMNMAANSSASFLVTGTVNSIPAVGVLKNTSAVDPSQTGITDEDTTNNIFTVTSNVLSGNIDFVINKALNNTCADPVNGNTYTISVSNNGANSSVAGQTVTVKDAIPAGFTVTSASGSGWTVSNSGNNYTFTRTDALNSTFAYPPIIIKVTPPSSGTLWTNTATVSYSGTESNTNNNSSNVTLYQKLSAPTVSSPVTYCQGNTAGALTASGTNLLWYNVAAGGTGSSTAPTPSTTQAGNTNYYVSQSNGSCESSLSTITVTVNATPAAPTGNSTQTFCQIANPTVANLQAIGTNIQWYSTAAGGSPLANSAALIDGTTYYASQTTVNCTSTSRLSVTVSITATPAPTAITTQPIFCPSSGATIANLQATGTNIQWYSGANGGTPLPTTTLLSSGTTYFASQTANGCESVNRLAVTVTFRGSQAPTGNTSQNFCQSANPTVANLQANGTNIQWYANSTGGTPLANTTALTNGTTYYATQTTNGCESDNRFSVYVTLTTTPPPTVNSPQTFCQIANPTIANLQAIGAAIKWYASAAGGTPLDASTALVNNAVYYFTQTANGCESLPGGGVTVIISSSPPPTGNANQTFCQSVNPTVANLQATGSNIQWYAGASGGTALASTTGLTNGTTYYASQITNGCESVTRLAVTVSITVTPAPTGNATQSFCQSANPTVANLQATGTNIQWYGAASGGTALTNTTGLTNGTTYYASQTTNGCESVTRLAVTVTITNTAPPTGNATQSFCQSTNATVANLQSTGSNIQWYAAASGGSALASTTLLTNATTYYASQTINGCESGSRLPVSVTLVAPPTTANAGPDKTQYNTGIFELNANTPAAGTGQWTVVSGAAVIADPSNPVTTATIAANTTATLRWTIANGICGASTDDVIITYTSQADLSITKTDNSTVYTPGTQVVYTVTVQNNGPSDVTGATVQDPLPAGITSASWTAVGAGGATATPAGTGALNQTVTMPSGGSIVYTITYNVPSSFTGNLTNTATVSVPAGITDPNPANNTATDTDTPVLQYNLSVTKTAPASAIAGAAINFKIVIVNNGPSDMKGAAIRDVIPATVTNVSWTAGVQGSGNVSAATGTGNNISLTGDLVAGASNSITINVTGTVSSAATGTISNTATVTPSGQPAVSSNTTNTSIQSQTGIQVVKAGPSSGNVSAGSPIQYTITITNAGPSDAVNTAITDNVPSNIGNVTWTASTQGTATAGTASGTGNTISLTGSIPAGAGNAIVLQVSGTVNAAATGTINNTATVTPQTGSPVSGQNNTTVTVNPGLSITKTGPSSAAAGSPVSYTITVTNSGPSDALNTAIKDVIASNIQNVTWAATASGAATIVNGATGNINNLLVTANIPAGAANVITIQVNGTIASSAAGTIPNTATAGITGQTPVSSTVNTAVTNQPGLSIIKSGPPAINAGSNITYTIEVDNAGPSDASGVIITDAVPAQIKNVTWITALQGSATVTASGASGSGNAINIKGNIPAGASNKILITITGTVDPAYTGTVTNTATVTPATGTPVTSTPVVTTVTGQPAVSIQKTGPSLISAGENITYTLVVTNAGPSNATNTVITDAIPAQILNASWTAVTNGIASITAGATGSGNSLNITGAIPAGAGNNITVTITGKVNPSYAGTLTNTATAGATGQTTVTSPPVTTTVLNFPGLTISKSGPSNISAGSNITYTIAVGNTGPSDAIGAIISDAVPVQITGTSRTTSTQGSAAITAGATGAGNTVSITGNIPAGASNKILITITGTVDPSYAGMFNNAATVLTPGGTPIVTPAVVTNVTNKPAVSIQKTGPSQLAGGQAITYTMVVTNAGPSNANNVVIADSVPLAISNISWTATAGGTASIAAGSTGSGRLVNIAGAIPAGAGNNITVTVTGTVNAAYTGTIVNTATAGADGQTTVTSPPVTTTVLNLPGLSVSKAGPSSVNAGSNITYTIEVDNAGPSDASNITVGDVIPGHVLNTTWTTSVQGAATITTGATGTGNTLSLTGNIPAGTNNKIFITIAGTVDSSYTGSLTNTAVASTPGGTPIVTPAVVTNVTNKPAVSIQKTGPSQLAGGQAITYTLVVTNAGPSNANNVVITDAIPAQVLNATWAATTNGTATVTTGATGTGNTLNITGAIPAGAGNSITITVTGKVDPAYAGTLTNTATAGADNQTTVTSPPVITTVLNSPGITMSKSGPPSASAGSSITYTIEVDNAGPSNASNLTIGDVIPAQVLNASWTTSVQGSATITAGATGTGNTLNITGNILAGTGNKILITITGTIDPSYAGTLTNSATAQVPGGIPIVTPAVVTSVSQITDLTIQKSGPQSIVAGQNITYTILAGNAGPSNANNINITDNIPSDIQNVTWTAVANGSATINGAASGIGNVLNISANIPAGAGNTISVTVQGTVVSSSTASQLINTATATPGAGAQDPTPAISSVTTTVSKQADLRIVKSGPANRSVNQTISYILAVTNNGPSDVTGAIITDVIPAQIVNPTFTIINKGYAFGTGSLTGNTLTCSANISANAGDSVIVEITGTVIAAGNITNTATVTVPAGVTDPNPANNTSSVSTAVTNDVGIIIAKSGPATANIGDVINYSIEITNTGVSDAAGVAISDIVPPEVTNVTWTATATGNGGTTINSNAGGGNSINFIANIEGTANGPGKVVLLITGIVSSTAGATITNTATANYGGQKSSTFVTSINKSVSLRIVKSGPSTAKAGAAVTYTLDIYNAGPADASAAAISDILPAGINNITWTATASGAAGITDNTSGNTGTVSLHANLPAGAANRVTVTINGTIDPSFGGNLVNTATISSTDGKPNISPSLSVSTVTTTVTALSGLTVIKSGPTSVPAGQSLMYTIDVTNSGPSNASNINITDAVPVQLQNVAWTTAAMGTANVTAGNTGSGNTVSVTANIAAGTGNSIRIIVTGTVDASYTGTLTNTATATPQGGTPVTSTPVNTTVTNVTALQVVKSGPSMVNAGNNISYTIQINNAGPSNAQSVSIADILPPGILNATWSATAAGNAGIIGGNLTNQTGNVNFTANIPAGQANIITVLINGKVDASFTGTITNTATATPPGGVPVTSTPVVTQVQNTAAIQIAKSGPTAIAAGQSLTYTINVTNNGPSNASNINITDAVPVQLQNVSWTTAIIGSASITAGNAGTGNTVNVTGNIVAGSGNAIRITITGTVDPAYTGTITNTATATPQGGTPVVSPPVSTTVTNTSALQVSKSGPSSVNAGDNISYTISISNAGPSNAQAVNVADIIPAGILNAVWSATAAGGAVITGGNLTNQTGNVNFTANIPAGAANIITVLINGKVDPSLTGTLTNTATATPQGGTAVTSPPVVTQVHTTSAIQVTKAGPSSIAAGQSLTYTIDITNSGPSNASVVTITDAVPVQLQNTSWTTTVTGTASVATGSSGTGNTINVTGSIAAGAGNAIRITITGTVDPAYTGVMTNTATATPQGGTPVTSSPVNTTVTNKPGLQVVKSGPSLVNAGGNISYTININNAGPSNAQAVNVGDIIPAGILNATWSAMAAGNAMIIGGNLTNQTGNVNFVANIPAGQANTITVLINGKVDANFTGTITNTATTTPQGGAAVSSPPVITQVQNSAAIQIVKAGPSSIAAGQNLTYTIDVTNNGPSNASNINITDAVPAQLQNVSWVTTVTGGANITAGNTGTGNTISVQANIPAGTSNAIRVTITGTVNAGYTGTITNTATATPQGGTPVASSPVNTVVTTQTNIQLVKTAPANVVAGTSIQYTILVTNTGPSTANNIDIADVVPSPITNVIWSAQTFGSTSITGINSGTGNTIHVAGTIFSGSSNYILLKVTGTVDPSFAGTITNTATATLPSTTPVNSNTTTTAVTKNADLVIQKTGPSSVFESNTVTWRLQVNNTGPSSADGATVKDVLPAGIINPTVTVISVTGGAGNATAAITANTMNATIGSLPSGGQCILQITGTVQPGVTNNLINTATVSAPAGVTDPSLTNNSSQVSTSVIPKGVLKVAKTVLTSAPYAVGQTVSYTLKVTNTGLVGITPVTVTDLLPPVTKAGTPVIHTAPAGTSATYNVSTNTINWNIGLMNAGTSLSLTYDVTILDTGTVVNTAFSAGPSNVSIPDTATSTINTDLYADLAIVKKLLTQQPFAVGKDVTFSITVNNNGPNNATNVNVNDLLPSNLDAVKDIIASAGTTSYDVALNNLVWNIGTLNTNGSATLTFSVRIKNGGSLSNTAIVLGSEKDPDTSNNTSTTTPETIGDDDIWIPNIITPNGDGKNDKFVILGLTRYPGSDLVIYNRWQNQVYHSTNYSNDWDGNGLTQGTYYYVLKVNKPTGIEVKKGWVLLMK
ncbi:gliding motility-associated C-terminal domain-containing protein [Chitinophagaceae bacterium LWZ2-11]